MGPLRGTIGIPFHSQQDHREGGEESDSFDGVQGADIQTDQESRVTEEDGRSPV